MKGSFAAVLAFAAGTMATYPSLEAPSNGTVYTTITTTELITYCPYATTLTQNGKTYEVTEATTLTITDCPCTIIKPVILASTVLYTSCPEGSAAPAYTRPIWSVPANKSTQAYKNPLTIVYTTAAPTKAAGNNGGNTPGGSATAKPATQLQVTSGASTLQFTALVVCAFAAAMVFAL